MKRLLWVIIVLAALGGLFVLSSSPATGPEPVPTQTEIIQQPSPEEAHNNLFHSDTQMSNAAECDQALDHALTGIVDDPEGEALALALWQMCRASAG